MGIKTLKSQPGIYRATNRKVIYYGCPNALIAADARLNGFGSSFPDLS
jgi:hypothetical protein